MQNTKHEKESTKVYFKIFSVKTHTMPKPVNHFVMQTNKWFPYDRKPK